MEEKIIYDFDAVISREGTFAEKYEARERFFGSAAVEPFWVADMDLPTPAFLVDHLRERLAHPMFGYTEQYNAVFDAIVWWMKNQHGATVDPKWISLSSSVVTSISIAIQSLTEPGDSVIVLSPVYGPFFSCTQANGRNVADCPLRIEQGRFEIDFAALEKTMAQADVKLLMLCNPHNPGGRVWSPSELAQLAHLCATNGVILFSDEIHCDIVYPPHRHNSMLNIAEASGNCIVAHSIGKTFNTSGLQASFSIIPDAALRKRFRAGLERVHAGDVNLLGKVALAAALSPEGADYKRQLVDYLGENTRLVCEKLQALEGVDVMAPEATFLVWSDFRKHGAWPEVFKRLIHNADVALSGGTFFGPAGEGWFRINCAHPRSKLLPAVDRIVAEFQNKPH
ncbi:MalY/PatB family protein [Pontiella sulfatireligans]|uniref:cysteine-S-conjugate beta-lyase n=1 Tax=Pontiella sulfatireligans TaxID=2750658 RepID=A0A6C2UR38_9BACT|nr:PatB family C-S lyase [Pontiella sulfatireligans]VGO22569.1 Cystathionine beta-lyase PatB [Pontiella sulfatireligans]